MAYHNYRIMVDSPIQLDYDSGTVIVRGGPAGFDFGCLPGVLFDARTSVYRAQGRHYRAIVEYLVREKIPYVDSARTWDNKPTGWTLTDSRVPHPHQREAVQAWWKSGGRGVVVLPTGTGKTFVAFLCLQKVNRPTLVVTPYIELMNQWYGQLKDSFQQEIGIVGGGYYEFRPITVTTYDSAASHVERWGHRYGLLIFDEVHHLPGPTYATAAVASLAPYRLGLTATPERADGGEAMYPELVGPIVYRREIVELSGDHLAPYRTEVLGVSLTASEAETYHRCRAVYNEFRQILLDRGVNLQGENGWRTFIFEAGKTPEGRRALAAFREQKRIERSAEGKFRLLERLMERHAADRMLIFTADNATVYQIARRYLVPAITHQTKTRERKQILERFHTGEYSVLVTSQVLNEGVDVPAAGVGVIFSGSGSIKENVQRLGRILRKYKEKQAVLYELVAEGTAEEFTSGRRRQHHAFQ